MRSFIKYLIIDKTKKKKTKKIKLNENEKKEVRMKMESQKKKIRERENRQLIWFLIIVGLVFLGFLIPYFYFESQKTFRFGGVDWNIDDSDQYITFYHAEFPALNGANLNYNIYLRYDPRENDVETSGEFNAFRYGGYLSWTEDIEACRGQVPRAALDLKSFVRTGVGIGNMNSGALTPELSEKLGFPFINCLNTLDRTVIVLRMGEPSVIQSETNPFCYVISIKDCDDFEPIEKFIVKTIDDSTRD